MYFIRVAQLRSGAMESLTVGSRDNIMRRGRRGHKLIILEKMVCRCSINALRLRSHVNLTLEMILSTLYTFNKETVL